jgi:hypothetical protein
MLPAGTGFAVGGVVGAAVGWRVMRTTTTVVMSTTAPSSSEISETKDGSVRAVATELTRSELDDEVVAANDTIRSKLAVHVYIARRSRRCRKSVFDKRPVSEDTTVNPLRLPSSTPSALAILVLREVLSLFVGSADAFNSKETDITTVSAAVGREAGSGAALGTVTGTGLGP